MWERFQHGSKCAQRRTVGASWLAERAAVAETLAFRTVAIVGRDARALVVAEERGADGGGALACAEAAGLKERYRLGNGLCTAQQKVSTV